MQPVSRKEDMSPRGQLKLHQDDDGDYYVSVYQDDGNGMIVEWATVEFCMCGMGGGKSPNTRKALVELAKAMELDNEESPSRAGDL
jgi:hypothetical protein